MVMVIYHLPNGMILQAQEDLDDDLEKYFGRSSGEVGRGDGLKFVTVIYKDLLMVASLSHYLQGFNNISQW